MHSYCWWCMVNQNWKLELEEVILLSVFGYSKSKQTKTDFRKPKHFRFTDFRIWNWMDLFPCVANALHHIFATWFEFWERNVFAVVCFLQGKEKGFVTRAFLCFRSLISTYSSMNNAFFFFPAIQETTKLGFSWKTAKVLHENAVAAECMWESWD